MKQILLLYATAIGIVACVLFAETAFQTGKALLYFFAAACMLISLICALACRRSEE